MSDAEEAQHLVDISLKKIVAWRNKRHGVDLHRNLLLASVLLKAHFACSSTNLKNLDDHETSLSSLETDDDDVDCDDATDGVTVTLDDVSGFDSSPRQKDDVQHVGSIQNWDVIPDQALEEWDYLGSDTSCEQLDSGDKTSVKGTDSNGNKGKPTNVQDDRDSNLTTKHVGSRPNKRKLEFKGSENDSEYIACKKQRTENAVSCCEKLCMDFDDLMSSVQGECSISTVESLDSSNLIVEPLVHSFEESICATGKNYFDDIDRSSDLFSC